MVGVNPKWTRWLAQSLGGDMWMRRGAWMATTPITNEKMRADIAIHARTYGKPEPPLLVEFPRPRNDQP